MIPEDITHIDISIPKDVAIQYVAGSEDDFYLASATVAHLIGDEMKRLADEIRARGDELVMIERLKEKGAMSPSSQTAPDCLQCMNGKTLSPEEKCQECGRYVDNYGELFPMR